ncbi:biopolymer transporter ExbD [Roseicyclus sp.]|uniref:biopolymer transporter ExbD n=1 Tax=Roseicyclus sp. TaxID=1914329 RepID=UPI003F6B8C69
MNFAPARKRHTDQDRAIVPMINVVFLLLVFFLMTASLTPPPPLAITAPMAETPRSDPQPGTLYIAADGQMIFGTMTGDAALAALSAARPNGPLPIMADAAYPAAELARLLPRLAGLGVTDIRLITVQP